MAQRFQEEKPGLKVIITSGYNTDHVDLEAVAAASIVYLPKPCEPEVLLETIRRILGPAREPGAVGSVMPSVPTRERPVLSWRHF